jgi:hypothetical protein
MHNRPSGAQPGYVGTNAFAALDTTKTKKKKKLGAKDKDDKSKKDKGKSTGSIAGAGGLGASTLPPIADVEFDDLDWAQEDEDDGFAMAPMADWVQVTPLSFARSALAHVRCRNMIYTISISDIDSSVDQVKVAYESLAVLQEHQQMNAQARAAAQDDQEEVEDDQHDMVDIAAQLGMEVGQEDDDSDEEESETYSKQTSRNVSEIVSAGASQRAMEPKIEEKQLSKKVNPAEQTSWPQ